MRKFIFGAVAALALTVFAACGEKIQGMCRIHGTVTDARLNGANIFLVPVTHDNPGNVDSVRIENGKFEFVSDTVMVAKLIVDYHVRYGTQTLLVVVEPGDVNVTFGASSSGGGTPLNDSLQMWKAATERHNSEYGQLNKQSREAEKAGKKAESDLLKAKADSLHLSYKQYSRLLAGNVRETVLGDFLSDMFPLKFKRTKPDSTIVWVDADTHEELGPVEE